MGLFFFLHASRFSAIDMINFANRTNTEPDLNMQMFVSFPGLILPAREGPSGHPGS